MKYLSLLFFTICVACSPRKNDELQTLKSEVLAVHDEVMPKMGELSSVRKRLMLLADSLKSSDSLRAVMLTSAANDIANANEGMMQWMRNYEPDFEGTDEEIKNYFKTQKKDIEQVKQNMIGSLARGREILGN